MRECVKTRKTKETEITLRLNIDGSGTYKINTGIKFFNHMLEQLAHHAGFDFELDAVSLDEDRHHLVEDVAITLGTAISDVLGDKRGIKRYGEMILPMDDALILTAIDISGRIYSKTDVTVKEAMVSDFDSILLPHFFYSFAQAAKMTIHIKMLDGQDSHHIIEATFKSFARALKKAISYDEENIDKIPSTKGIL